MHVVLVVDNSRLCSLGEVDLEIAGHTAQPFLTDDAAAAWCKLPENHFDAAIVFLNFHAAAAGLRLACRIARSRPGVRINAAWGGFVQVPNVLASIRVLHKPVTWTELFDLGDGRS